MDTFGKRREEREGVEWVGNGVTLGMSSSRRRSPCWRAAVGGWSKIAGELGISPSMLRNWRNRQGGQQAGSAVLAKPASAMPCVADRAAEISRLCRENDRLRMERDISGKAVALFSEAPR